ncbi:MAG: hypothetical protein J7K15_15410 [Deltaproteobacteria bacterium]|nr:hypothetical protein [Deltaproteobacteria bacterium]
MAKKARKKKKKETKKKQRVIKNETTHRPKVEFSVDDSVVIKEGILDPDYGNDISGWQGRIYEIDDNFDDPLIRIEWDSMTLRNMPRSVIEDSEKDGLVWSKMDLYASDLEPSKHRDSEEEVAKTLEMISEKYDLEEFDDGDTGLIKDEIEIDQQMKRIQAILKVNDEDDMVVNDENLEKYFQYLNKNIAFLCIVTGIEDFRWEEFYVLGPGDQDEYEELKKTQPSYTDHYRILSFDDHYDEDNGILANVRRVSDKRKFTLPLEDLEAVGRTSINYQILDDYSVWFVNYR